MPDKGTARRRGRRGRGTVDAQRALLDAARYEFARRGFAGATLKSIAGRARLDVAMVRYYFGSKQGLYEAVVESTLRGVMRKLARADGRAYLRIRRFIRTFMTMLADNPWLPPLLIRELASERTPLHRVFDAEFFGGLLPLLLETVSRSQEVGELDGKLDPRLAAQALLAMTLLPFVLTPRAAPVLGLRLSGRDLRNLITQTERQFIAGAGPDPPPGD